ncbi:MAG: hypothetical protein MUF27_04330 [Acidobacteria bacterium]|nr:hypothetical protein [Acidobacteriota bacterium]
MDRTPPSVLARMLRGHAGALAGQMRESLEALVGRSVQLERLQADHPELPRLFGQRELFLFPFADGDGRALPTFLALDRPAAVATGAAFGLMNTGGVREAADPGELPEPLLGAIREVAGILGGAARRMVRARGTDRTCGFGCGHELRRVTAGAWPAIVGEIDHGVRWDLLGFRLRIDGEPAGAILLGSSERWEGPLETDLDEDADTAEVFVEEPTPGSDEYAGTAAAPAPFPANAEAAGPPPPIPQGIRVQVAGDPKDRATAALRTALAEAGCHVLPAYSAGGAGPQPSVLFVFSRSPIDLRMRLAASLAKRRAGLIVACSDRPTADLVRAAHAGTADSFLVLPADRLRLQRLFQRFAELAPA